MARALAAVESRSPARGVTSVGWPAIGFVVAVLAAALFSFSPRPAPAFSPTHIHPADLLINGLAKIGSHLVAVGDLGHILIADSPQGAWREAKVDKPRGSGLNRVAVLDDNTAVAVGHDGWILRTSDGGESWNEVAFDPDQGNSLLGIAGPYEGRLFTFGGFGTLQSSDDGGKTWQPVTLDEPAAKAAGPAKPVDPNANPFADAASTAPGEDRHIYGLTRLTDGSLFLVGERGLMKRSRDRGDHWESLPSIYAGSFFGVLALPQNGLLVYGMRGNVFRSTDGGGHWTKIAVPTTLALLGGALTPSGDILLVGDATTILHSRDAGASFTRVGKEGRKTLSTILPLDDTHWLTGGEAGVGQTQFLEGPQDGKPAGGGA